MSTFVSFVKNFVPLVLKNFVPLRVFVVKNNLSKILPSRQRIGEHFLVGEFEDAAGGDAAGEAGDLDGRAFELAHNVQGRAVALDGRVRAHDQFLDRASFDSFD